MIIRATIKPETGNLINGPFLKIIYHVNGHMHDSRFFYSIKVRYHRQFIWDLGYYGIKSMGDIKHHEVIRFSTLWKYRTIQEHHQWTVLPLFEIKAWHKHIHVPGITLG
jgi:hypothetical protein